MSLKIKKFRIKRIRQFRDVVFDFSDPNTGKPLDRVCLIGGNGTGKSTILKLLGLQLGIFSSPPQWMMNLLTAIPNGDSQGAVSTEYFFAEETAVATNYSHWAKDLYNEEKLDGSDPDEKARWIERIQNALCVFCPPDSELSPPSYNNSLPNANLNQALGATGQSSTKFKVGQDNVGDFWIFLIALVKRREANLLEHHRLPENRNRIVGELEEEFLSENPDILRELADFWKPILAKAGLKFDYEGASIPIQLTDNLKAYIKLAADNAIIPYADLSTGIRSFLFRLGHLFTIFRFHPNSGGIVLIDEPENSLHPDFLFDLISYYEQTAPGAQMFFATHSPIVAAQFKPEERFILEFDPDLGVSVRRGVSPEGDDPNDILMKDFAVRTLYGAKGVESWKRFRELDLSIQTEADPQKRKAMLKEYLELGRTYNFDPQDEVSA